jgi:hypothetical protein
LGVFCKDNGCTLFALGKSNAGLLFSYKKTTVQFLLPIKKLPGEAVAEAAGGGIFLKKKLTYPFH